MKKFAVHYRSRRFGDSYVHIFAVAAFDAVEYVATQGIGFDNGPVFADRVVAVEEVR